MRYLAILLLAFAPQLHAAETLENFDEARALAEDVMEAISAGNTLEGVDMLRPYVVFPMHEFETLKGQIRMQLPLIKDRFGDSLGYEFMVQDEMGLSVKRIVYLQKLERHVLLWTFVFYRPENEWLLNTFHFSDMIEMGFPR